MIREGFDPGKIPPAPVADPEFAVGDDEDEDNQDNVDPDEASKRPSARYGDLDDRNVWNEG